MATNLAKMFLACLDGRGEMHCMATQYAIDELASEFGRGRQWLRDLLLTGRLTHSDLHSLFLCGWARAPLKLATGRTRDEWLDVSDAMRKQERRLSAEG